MKKPIDFWDDIAGPAYLLLWTAGLGMVLITLATASLMWLGFKLGLGELIELIHFNLLYVQLIGAVLGIGWFFYLQAAERGED